MGGWDNLLWERWVNAINCVKQVLGQRVGLVLIFNFSATGR